MSATSRVAPALNVEVASDPARLVRELQHSFSLIEIMLASLRRDLDATIAVLKQKGVL